MSENNYPSTPFGSMKAKLEGVSWTGDFRNRPTLEADLYNNNPRLVVWANNPTEIDKINPETGRPMSKRPITCAMGIRDMLRVLDRFDKIAQSESSCVFTTVFKGPGVREDGSRDFANKVPVAKMRYGRNDQGLCFLIFSTKHREPVRFLLGRNEWVENFAGEEQLTEAQESGEELGAFSQFIRMMLPPIMQANHVPNDEVRRRLGKGPQDNKPAASSTPAPVGNSNATVPATFDDDVEF